MLHLTPERLAALADDEATADEARHLALCAMCERERRAQMALLALAGDAGARSDAEEPLTNWDELAAALRAEGRIVTPDLTLTRGEGRINRIGEGSRPAPSRWWLRAAAAALLVSSGVAVGRLTASPGAVVGAAGAGPAQSAEAPGDDTPVHAVSFASPEEARETLARAERDYRNAMGWLVQHDSGSQSLGTPATYRARLAALDELAGAARRGVDESPYDPLINQYYLSALAARQATLQQLDRTLPTGVRLTQF